MEERGLEGLEARSADGTRVGRVAQVIVDEGSGEVTHVLVEGEGGEQFEVPITDLSLDPEADFATFGADPSDVEPGDHVEDDVEPQGYAPSESETDDAEHEGQFVTAPTDENEAASPDFESSTESGQASGWEDEESTTVDSGYPRTDAYIDPDTGEEVVDPQLEENDSLDDDVRDLLNGTSLTVRSVKDGVVELSGSVPTREDLDGNVNEVMGLDGVLDVDTTDVDVG